MENKETVVSSTKDIKPSTKDESNLVSRMVEANELANDPEVVKETFKYGNVPVVYMPTRAMMRPSLTPGLLEFIRKAKTVKEVESLLKRSVKFEHASPKTIRKWEKAAAIRTIELNGSLKEPKTTPKKTVKRVRKIAKTKNL